MDEVRGGKEGGIGADPNNNSCGTRPRPGPGSGSASAPAPAPAEKEKKGRPAAAEQLNCPRCNSSNTKFCYYNNYSLTQPRYFCKTCRRYWTEGGSLRNIPVGGGSRKNKKQQLIASASATANNSNSSNPSKVPVPDLNPKMAAAGRGHDLNLAFPTAAMDMDKYHAIGISPFVNDSASSSCSSSPLSAMELLRSAGMASSGFNIPNYLASSSLMPNSSNALNYPSPSGFPMQMQDIKPNPEGFTVDGLGNRPSYDHQVQDHNAQRILFPFGEHIKHLSADKEQGNSTGYWTGMIGEGSSW